MRAGRFLLILCVVWGCCLAAPAERFVVPQDAKVIVTGGSLDGKDGTEPYCKEFYLTVQQVRTFFRKARYVADDDIHEYDWMPCYVDGTIAIGAKVYQWRIRPIGIGVLTAPDGKERFLGCKKCTSVFR